MNQLLQLVKDDKNNTEKTYPVLPQTFTDDLKIIAQFNVPFNFNSIVLCVSGGIVAVTHGPVTEDPANPGFALASSPFNWLFGSNGVTPGSTAGGNPQPIQLFTGPQEIRFREREKGQLLTLWVHPESHLALRAAIDPTYANLVVVGAVEFLK